MQRGAECRGLTDHKHNISLPLGGTHVAVLEKQEPAWKQVAGPGWTTVSDLDEEEEGETQRELQQSENRNIMF